MTLIGFLNRYILQWFGIRIIKYIDYNITHKTGYGLMIGVVPLTGWSIPFKGPCWKVKII